MKEAHWLLSFSTHTGFPFSPGPTVWAGSLEMPYKVWQGNSPTTETVTAEQAVALAVGLLPDDVGPAVAGPYRGELVSNQLSNDDRQQRQTAADEAGH
jgi:hypothetical protein